MMRMISSPHSVFFRLVTWATFIFLGANLNPQPLSAEESHSTITVQAVLEEAKRANPELAALTAQVEVSDLEASTQFYLPSPMFSIGSMGLNGPLSSEGHMQTSFQLSQQIPFPTKIFSRRRALKEIASASRSSAEARWIGLKAQVQTAYVNYWQARETQTLMNDKIKAISDHKRRLRAGPLSTQLMQAHLAAADTDLALANADIETAVQEETAARGELNALMGKDAFATLPRPVEPPLSALPPPPSRETIENASDLHPEVQEARALSQAAASEAGAARSEFLPDFTLSYRYNKNTPLAADESNSEVMLGVSLPFAYFWQPRALSRAAEARESRAQAQLRARQNNLKLQLLKKYAELSSLRSQYLRFTEVVLPSSNRRGRISHGIAPTDMEALTEHREASERPIELRLKALELKSGFEKSLAEYDSLLGVDP